MAVPQAWRLTRGDPRVVVAVVDTGIRPDPDLVPNLLPGFNAIDGSADTTDDHGHGSEQAALIGSVLDNGIGAAGICGRCRILPVKVMRPDGSGDLDAIARGIRWAAEHGADVINLSVALGPGAASAPAVNEAISAAVARGVIVIAAAGNGGSSDPAANTLAAANPRAIRVGAIDAHSHRLDPVSNRGSWVDVAAAAQLTAQDIGSLAPSGSGGTSAAAAAVSAISGLVLSCNPALTPAQVKNILVRTSTPYGVKTASGGEVNAYRAALASGCADPDAEPPVLERVKLTMLVRGSGTIGRRPTSGWYAPGTTVRLQARPRTGWEFDSWRGPCAGHGPICRFSVGRPVTVTAVFGRESP